MNFKELQKQLKAMEGVSKLSLVRDNVIKIDLERSSSKDFFIKMKEECYFEHCSLITAIDNQPNFELVYHLSCLSGELKVGDTKMAAMLEVHVHLERDSPSIDSVRSLVRCQLARARSF
ncbi:MAG: hypothetical protein CM15mP42_07750 [Methanobacteriota archaeon]|nr:MAG: hypothetical protein CM15mP42_07750 [Euryarchaeota archaeon]